MTSTAKGIFDYIFGLTVPGVKLDLERVTEFMGCIGKPYESYPVVHVAGTNGKGSTCAILSAILQASGKRVGLFTSPHLIKPNERIRVDGAQVTDEFIIRSVESWRPQIDRLGITFFEVLTALGMAYFKEQKVDIAVIETGLGGRLDATNVVDPMVSVITSIALDHQNILGDDLAQIAAEKAGIIKAHRPVVIGRNEDVAMDVLLQQAEIQKADVTLVQEAVIQKSVEVLGLEQRIHIQWGAGSHSFDFPLLGVHQVDNLANALAAYACIEDSPDPGQVQKGLSGLKWPGRMQVLQEAPLVLYDVATTEAGLKSLMRSLDLSGNDRMTLVVAFNARKDVSTMQVLLKEWGGEVKYTSFAGHSALSGEELRAMGISEEVIYSDPLSAYEDISQKDPMASQGICFLGSHYLAEELYPAFGIKI